MTDDHTWTEYVRKLRKLVPDDEELPGPRFAADDWTQRARDALADWELSRTDRHGDEDGLYLDVAEDAMELLVVRGGLLRLRPELVEGALPERVERAVQRDAESIAGLVSELAIPGDWSERAETGLEKSFDPDVPEATKSRRAVRLLRRLDDFELASHGLVELQAPRAATIRRDVDAAVQWAIEHPETFLEARRYVYAQFTAFREDLNERDPDLALTQMKFHCVVEALERQRRYLAGETVPTFEVTDRMREQLDTWRTDAPPTPGQHPRGRKRARRAWRSFVDTRRSEKSLDRYTSRPPLPRHRPAAMRAAEEGDSSSTRLDWEGPDEDWTAFMMLPPVQEASDDEHVTLWLLGAEDATAVELVGLHREIPEDESDVEFSLAELRERWEEFEGPTLAVYFDDEVGFGELVQ